MKNIENDVENDIENDIFNISNLVYLKDIMNEKERKMYD